MDLHKFMSRSYYVHDCTVMSEKDVLFTDLIGLSPIVKFKRWWHNMFLLSYSKKSRYYYTSSHAMKMERARQYRYYRNSIHPLSSFRNCWDCMILIAVIINKLLFNYNTSLIAGTLTLYSYIIGVALEFLLVFDVFVHLKTGYLDPEWRRTILSTRKILIHYASTKLFGHVVSAIPLQGIMLLRYGLEVNCDRCKSNKFVSTLRILNIFSLYRLYDASKYWTKNRRNCKRGKYLVFLRVCVLAMFTVLYFIQFMDTVSLLMFLSAGYIEESSVFSLMLKLYYWADPPLSSFTFICFELARVCKSFLLFSFGLRPNMYYFDKIAALISYIIVTIFYVWNLRECFSYMARWIYPEEQVNFHKDSTINLLYCRRLPDKFQAKVNQYYNSNVTPLKLVELKNGLFSALPGSLKREIKMVSYFRFLKRIPFFMEWPLDLIKGLVSIITEEVFLANDVIAQAWKRGDGLIILESGVIAVYTTEDKEVGHLIDGDYFGEVSLVTDNEVRMSSVIAATTCKILFLDKVLFRVFMRDYPRLFFEMKKRLRNQHLDKSKSNESEIMSTYGVGD